MSVKINYSRGLLTLAPARRDLKRERRRESDDHAVALTNVTARRGDHNYDSQDIWVFHLREGEIAEAWWRP
jgi:hypothetical protein